MESTKPQDGEVKPIDSTLPVQESPDEENKDEVTPFLISADKDTGIDYDKLVDRFGCTRMTDELREKIEKLTGRKPHRFIRRNIFFCHRDLDVMLNRYEQKQLFYLYTGRGPSAEALHLGHAIPFIMTRYMQEAFDLPLVVQITDDEKFLYRPELELEKVKKMAISNIKDIIAFGFDPEKTFIFMDTEYIKELYPNVIKVQKLLTLNQIKGVFGFNDSDPVGKFAYPPIQAVPSFCNTFPHIFGSRKNIPSLIPCAIDQDPYFRMTRDVAARLKYEKTGTFYSTFFPGLEGMKGKMSSSNLTHTILLTDSPADVKKKINKYAFSGGGATVEEQREKGANLDVDMAYQYLKFFMEDDDELADIGEKYKTGKLLTGEVKNILVDCLSKFMTEFQERRKLVTDEDVKHFMAVRPINPAPKAFQELRKAEEAAKKLADEASKKETA